MKLKALSISTLLGFLGVILMIHSFNVKAETPRIKCSTAFGEKNLIIEEKSVSYVQDNFEGQTRSISSTRENSVTTLKTHEGFTKTLYLEGNKHQINVKNTNAFSETEDYLTITSPKGHKMTYPLNCESAS
jgi:hypothetical protein